MADTCKAVKCAHDAFFTGMVGLVATMKMFNRHTSKNIVSLPAVLSLVISVNMYWLAEMLTMATV